MTTLPITLWMTLSISPLIMREFPEQRHVREYLMDQGLWPPGAIQERWQPDFATPGSYTVSLEFQVSLPSGTP